MIELRRRNRPDRMESCIHVMNTRIHVAFYPKSSRKSGGYSVVAGNLFVLKQLQKLQCKEWKEKVNLE